jgi:hypothetical protein
LLAGVMLPMALFRASLAVERRLQLKQAQLNLAAALDARLLQIKHACDQHELSEMACTELGPINGKVWNRMVFDPLFPLNGESVFEPHASPPKSEEPSGPWFQSVVYLLHHDYNEAAAQTLGVIPDRAWSAKDRQASAPDWSWEDHGSQLTLRWHGFHVSQEPEPVIERDFLIRSRLAANSRFDLFAGAGMCLLVMLIIGPIAWSLVRRVFLFHVATLRASGAQQAAEAIRDGRNVVVLTPPASNWRMEGLKQTLDIAELARTPSWAESITIDAIPPNFPIELVHFEHMEGNAATDGQKFALLERLLNRPDTQIVVVMMVPVSAENYRNLFPGFKNDIFDLRDEPFCWRANDRGPAADLIWQECQGLPALWPLGAQLAKDLSRDKDLVEEEVHSRGTIASELLERAEPYYRMIWKECSDDQRFVLSQLAADGMPNPANERAIRQLVRRGLILTSPQFHIVNESFRLFLCSEATPAQRAAWRRESRYSGWGKVQAAFFIALAAAGAFLLTTQNALWDSAAAYVTTGMGVLGTISKFFNTYRGSAGGGAGKTG